MIAKIVEATFEHVTALKGRLRLEDDIECLAASSMDANEAMEHGFRQSFACWTGLLDDRPILIFGVVPKNLIGDEGIPWMLATDDIKKVGMTIGRESKRIVGLMLNHYSFLENYVGSWNRNIIRWLRWCGFHVEHEERIGPYSFPFCRFWIRRTQ